MAKTLAETFIGTLAAAGVKRIYGVVGDSLNGLTETIRKGEQLEWVHVRHEETAAFAAGAERISRASSRSAPGVVGPGTCT